MANKYWQGGAASIAQVQRWTLAGTWEASDIVRFQVGNRIVDVNAGSTVIDTVLATLMAAWAALDATLFPEFAEMTASIDAANDYFILTANTPGNSFTVTLHPLESDGSTDGDAQTINGSNVATAGTSVTANSSPNDGSIATNWSGGTVPADGDTFIFSDSNVDLSEGLDFSAINANVIVEQSYTGKIGRPLTNRGGYVEYRPTYLKIGAADSPAQSVTIGQGVGIGSGRIKIDAGASTTTFVVHNTGTPIDAGIPAVLLKGTDAANTLTVNKGTVGVAVLPYDESGAAEEAATIATLNVGYVTNPNGDSAVFCGPGVTLTTINQSGGRLEIETAATTITKTGGDLSVLGNGVTITTLNVWGGAAYVIGTTTITTANLSNAGILDYTRDTRGKVITNAVNCYGRQFKFRDPGRIVSSTSAGNVIVDLEFTDAIGNCELGSHIKLTRALL